MGCDRPRAPSQEGVSLTLPSARQSLAMLKDGFRTDRGSHSDLWSSSSSLESSSFPLPKQYLDVSSQTDISGSVSRQRGLLGASQGTAFERLLRWAATFPSPEELARGTLWGWLLAQASGAPFCCRSGLSFTGDEDVDEMSALLLCPECHLAMWLCL